MKIRIRRSYDWKCTLPLSEIRFGGDNPLTLVAKDNLEFFNEDADEWQPIPIVEDPIPEHPRDRKLREETESFIKGLDLAKLRSTLKGENNV